ncbi:DUF5368 family protein [Marinobacter salexigens]|uniref:DUF5368 family protein n=1 Tax=Marinobacter salexigens TaxID=1925763 RepID=UPI000C28B2DC|nr:DUF5368 family protein [Marinobacter salexigens]
MTFSLAGIFSVLSNAIQPFLVLILTILAVLVAVQFTARIRSYRTKAHQYMPAMIVALLVGASSVWWLPLLTHSQLAFVTTAIDWLALIAAALGVALLVWLVLHPLSYLIRGPR